MATKHPRLNITLDVKSMAAIQAYATALDQSASTIVAGLLAEKITDWEDYVLCQELEQREKSNKKLHTHQQAWGKPAQKSVRKKRR